MSFSFESPVDFNDSQTTATNELSETSFESPVDFNDSQTPSGIERKPSMFESPVDFNDSQTNSMPIELAFCLRAL